MSDSGRQIGECQHREIREHCVECEIAELKFQLQTEKIRVAHWIKRADEFSAQRYRYSELFELAEKQSVAMESLLYEAVAILRLSRESMEYNHEKDKQLSISMIDDFILKITPRRIHDETGVNTGDRGCDGEPGRHAKRDQGDSQRPQDIV